MRKNTIAVIAAAIVWSALPGCSNETSSTTSASSVDTGAMLTGYLSCFGFSTIASQRAVQVAGADRTKVLAMAHASVTGDLSGDTPITERELQCKKTTGL
jgi:outer membrane lipoprotein SlyB